MLDETTLAVVKTVSILQRSFPDVESKLSENPTSFVTGVLQDFGIEVADGFHVHTVNEGEGLPEEPNIGTEDRDVYFFRRSGEVQHHIIKGSPSGNDAVLQAVYKDKCCDCWWSCCVIEK